MSSRPANVFRFFFVKGHLHVSRAKDLDLELKRMRFFPVLFAPACARMVCDFVHQSAQYRFVPFIFLTYISEYRELSFLLLLLRTIARWALQQRQEGCCQPFKPIHLWELSDHASRRTPRLTVSRSHVRSLPTDKPFTLGIIAVIPLVSESAVTVACTG